MIEDQGEWNHAEASRFSENPWSFYHRLLSDLTGQKLWRARRTRGVERRRLVVEKLISDISLAISLTHQKMLSAGCRHVQGNALQ
ncbi:hypothetical protein ElyMa_000490200 [Elysia marginata]|uniref:Uncharacterized protein n=1 Tax=Elysia marginata TaxID=1093978 RepID=A0AAV4FVJ9_9GAST|nr:hypothetical protein ElyMa_000490200 [Elysia marginata]